MVKLSEKAAGVVAKSLWKIGKNTEKYTCRGIFYQPIVPEKLKKEK